ncbi:alkaline phosphatase D family protein [Asticcacaulis sp. 201]|uniref:alkaline phosphatase D family protein n=1 Tax=Asticcacaulis sp. 201 TaxID=3028787 RepID=UPI0029166DAD|nr:alkaline phosphatase D family protein [Asticcacaulis sp. 201]MDV6331271.1 alkaline phosphatase D family protein [Asticcacaulis sp. 201]
MRITRRRTLLAMTTLTAATGLGATTPPPAPKGPGFEHGVASGDPLTDRVILWTRLSGVDTSCDVQWQVARDDAFTQIVAQGHFGTDAGRDYTVKVDVAGLAPATAYVYRFLYGQVVSPTGRTRTLALQTDKVVLAAVSCSLHSNGYFNAYRAIADLDHVDAVVHLGDYIYEYGAGLTDYGMGNGRLLGRIPEPPHEIVSLSDYRTRHAQYKRDEDLQAAHARAPWICVFDDHEICNNPWKDGAENHTPPSKDGPGEGEWSVRKAVALKAYREWMPIRDPAPGKLSEAIYRSFRFGNLAELIMIETRLLARSKQLDFSDLKMVDGRPDFDTFRTALNDPQRELFGAEQRLWLNNTLQSSVRDGVRWQVLGNQVIMAKIAGPDLIKRFGPETVASLMASLPDSPRSQLQTMIGLFSRPDPFPLNLDAWDGYPAERERFYAMTKAAGARTIVLSGDSHTAWANELHDAAGNQVAVELGVTAITSPTRWLELPGLDLAQTLADQNEEVVAADDTNNGFVLVTLTPDEMIGEWKSVDTITSRQFTCTTQQRFVVKASEGGMTGFV